MPRIVIAEHRVGSVGEAICQGARQTEERKVEERRDDAIAEVLGDRFNGRGGDQACVQL